MFESNTTDLKECSVWAKQHRFKRMLCLSQTPQILKTDFGRKGVLGVKRERALQRKSKVEYLNVYKSCAFSFLIWFAAFPRAAICISELACFFRFLFRLVKAAAANRGAPVPNVHPWGISGRAHLSSFYFTACRQLCIFSDSKIHFFSPIFLRTKSWPFDIWCSNF